MPAASTRRTSSPRPTPSAARPTPSESAIIDDITKASSLDKEAGIVKDQFVPALEDELDDLRALKPSSDIEDEVNAVFASLESGINAVEEGSGRGAEGRHRIRSRRPRQRPRPSASRTAEARNGSGSSGETDTTDQTQTTDGTQTTDQTQTTDGTQTTDQTDTTDLSIDPSLIDRDQLRKIYADTFPKLNSDQLDCLTDEVISLMKSGKIGADAATSEIFKLLDKCNINLSDITP